MNSENIQIEKGIEIPTIRNKTGITETLRKMQIGDSIAITARHCDIYIPAKRIGIKVTIRAISRTELRVWRTA